MSEQSTINFTHGTFTKIAKIKQVSVPTVNRKIHSELDPEYWNLALEIEAKHAEQKDSMIKDFKQKFYEKTQRNYGE